MPKSTNGVTKSQRILATYHALSLGDVYTWDISTFPWSLRTFHRDIAILKSAGVRIKFSAYHKSYSLEKEKGHYIGHKEPDFPEGKSDKRFIEKIIRLIAVIDGAPEMDCDKWYMENIPNATRRTMQRDFAVLRSIGFTIMYVRSEEDQGDAEDFINVTDLMLDEVPLKHYVFAYPEEQYPPPVF